MGTDSNKKGYLWRPDEVAYNSASTLASATGSSLNSFLNDAVIHYVKSDEFKAKYERHKTAAEEAIAKLAGED